MELVIADTGAGILPEHKASIFRFDFSTKGKGTGFGLHDSANYIKTRGGTIELISEGKGKGAQTIILLPQSGVSHE